MTNEPAPQMKPAFDVEAIRRDFPILQRQVRNQRLVYLDNAASSLKPTQVIDRISRYYLNETSNVHRGAHYLAEQGTLAYEAARETVAQFLGAKLSSEIVFTRGTTESVNLVAQSYGRQNLKSGDEIILTEMEHHSNIVPWQMIAEETGALIKVIPINDAGELLFDRFLELLSKRTRIVSMLWTSNALGTINSVSNYIEAAHRVGAKVFIDAAQTVSNQKIDVAELDCDFLAFSGHKIFAPYGIGVLFAKQEILEQMNPYQGGGSMIANVTFEKTTWAEVPQKFEAGTPNISGAVALATALDYLSRIGLEAAARHEHQVLEYATKRLLEIKGLRIYGQAAHKASILSFNIDGMHASDIGSLVDQQGVALRAGHHCCQPLMRRLGVPATARASFSIYNTFAEVDLLHASLLKAKEFFS
jgi:cysteine desulfurase/selenocysteine lyase